jgi:hypothetical protein
MRSEELKPYLQGKWMAKNIKYGHGPLMDEYMVWGDGHAIAEDPDDKYGDIEYTKKSGRGQYDFTRIFNFKGQNQAFSVELKPNSFNTFLINK